LQVTNTLKAEQPYLKKIITIIKFVLVPLTFGFIFYKLFYSYHINDLLHDVDLKFGVKQVLSIGIVVVLMVLNWLVETYKWQFMLRKTEPVSYWQAFKAVLSGVMFNIITPNQLGDFAGRVIHLKVLDKIKGALIMVIGHTAQVLLTAILGLYALIQFGVITKMIDSHTAFWSNILLTILASNATVLFFKLHWLSSIKWGKKIKPYLDVFSLFNVRELTQIMGLSAIRYLIFVLQYYFLLLAFDVHLTWSNALIGILATFFAQSFIPGFLLVELGMRGASALWFFSAFTSSYAQVLFSAYSLWMINLMLPGLIGLIFILQWRANR